MVGNSGEYGGTRFELLEGDCFAAVDRLADDSVQLTVTSPPYNIGKDYERRSNMNAYLEPYEAFLNTLFTKTRPGGSVCWQVGTHVNGRQMLPLVFAFYPLFVKAGFLLRNKIIWRYGHGPNQTCRLSGRYEEVLWFTKGDDYTFNLDAIRVPQLYPGKKAYKGPNKGQLSGNPHGKNPSDVWLDILLEEWETGIFDIPNVKSAHPEKTGHPCQFPVELVQRFVLMASGPNDLIFDPFLGSGTSAIAALIHQRQFVGIEQDADYMATAVDRIRQLREGTLKTRPLGTPVQRPVAA